MEAVLILTYILLGLSIAGLLGLGAAVLNKAKRAEARVAAAEVCQCGHPAAYHHSEGCEKHETYRLSEKVSPRNSTLYDTVWALRQCDCTIYVGPNSVPLPEAFVLTDRNRREITYRTDKG
jgi:hypothetical protein